MGKGVHLSPANLQYTDISELAVLFVNAANNRPCVNQENLNVVCNVQQGGRQHTLTSWRLKHSHNAMNVKDG